MDPPFTGVAVKATVAPVQIAPVGEAAMLTLAGMLETTIMLIALEVAVVPEVQVSLDVTLQVILSLLANKLLVNVELFVPAVVPFTDQT